MKGSAGAMFLLLDEADSMRGSTAIVAKYEQARTLPRFTEAPFPSPLLFPVLLLSSSVFPLTRHSSAVALLCFSHDPQALAKLLALAAGVVDVSATNLLCFIDAIHRMRDQPQKFRVAGARARPLLSASRRRPERSARDSAL